METQTYIVRSRHLEKPRKKLREEGWVREEGTSPLKSVFDSSQLSGSINLQDGRTTLLSEKKNHGLRCKIRLLCTLGGIL